MSTPVKAVDAAEAIDEALVWITGCDRTKLWTPGARGFSPTESWFFCDDARGSADEENGGLPGASWSLPRRLHPKLWFELSRSSRNAAVSILSSNLEDGGETSFWCRQFEPVPRESGRWRSLKTEARGHYTVRHTCASLGPDGVRTAAEACLRWHDEDWRCDYLSTVDADVIQMFRAWCGLASSLAIARLRWWVVEFGYEGTALIALKTDPEGARAAFALRDLPNGRSRRAALRHWVREHYRKSGRVDAAEETKVRAHLRGSMDFAWNGLRCRIRPSLHDELLNEGIGTTTQSKEQP